jgi:hypothetical protein
VTQVTTNAPEHPFLSSAIYKSQAMETAKMLPTDEWIKKMWYLYTMEFYAATKKNEILSFA